MEVRSVVYKLLDVTFLMLCSPRVLFRPQLEWCFPFWSPHFRKDTDNVERIQRKATGMIRGLENVTCKERLKELDLFSLEKEKTEGKHDNVFKNRELVTKSTVINYSEDLSGICARRKQYNLQQRRLRLQGFQLKGHLRVEIVHWGRLQILFHWRFLRTSEICQVCFMYSEDREWISLCL